MERIIAVDGGFVKEVAYCSWDSLAGKVDL